MTNLKQRWKINSVKVQVLDKDGNVIEEDETIMEEE